MLPTIRLDDENFIEIFEKSRKMIPKIYPEWTDYNEHDPGITLMELLAWLKEMQQFYLDQIGDDNYKMYLKMLGVKRRRMTPAISLLQVLDEKDLKNLPKGTRFNAGNITFETMETERLEKNRIIKCVVEHSEGQTEYGEEMLNSGSIMNIPVFGEKPEINNRFLVFFDKPFSIGTYHKIYMEIFDEYEIKRNAFQDEIFPLADIEIEYYTKNGYQKCSSVEDTTHGFLNSGMWKFQIDQEMEHTGQGYVLRFVLNKSEYDVAPMINRLRLNVFPIIQKRTMCDCITGCPDEKNEIVLENALVQENNIQIFAKVGDAYDELQVRRIREKESIRLVFEETQSEVMVVMEDAEFNRVKRFETNGFPRQMYSIGDTNVLYDEFDIMIRESYDNKYYVWEKVEDFHCSLPEDRHYVFDEEHGIVIFGDCEHGMAPQGTVSFIRYATSEGVKGNIKKNRIDRQEYGGQWTATNCYDISNGSEKETIEEAFERFIREQKKVERAVTLSDYEEIVKKTPGLRIRKVKAISAMEQGYSAMDDKDSGARVKGSGRKKVSNEISVVVQPYSYMDKAKLSRAYYKNICRQIDEKRMIGTKVNIISPEYYGATVFIEVNIHPHYSEVTDIFDKVIQDYFERDVSEFGSPIIYSDLFGRIDALTCVSSVRSLSVSVQGKNVIQTKNEDIIIPKNGLLYLKSVDYVINFADY